jgi:hypothetical protein
MCSVLWLCSQGKRLRMSALCVCGKKFLAGIWQIRRAGGGGVGPVNRDCGSGPCRTAELDETLCQCCFHRFEGSEQIHL